MPKLWLKRKMKIFVRVARIFYTIKKKQIMNNKSIYVASEIGKLKRLLVHSPDGGIGKIIPTKFKDWLYDDTVQLSKMQEEYDEYIKILLYFLDPDKIKEVNDWQKKNIGSRDILMPNKDEYFSSNAVVEIQELLTKILKNKDVKSKLVSAVCSIEGCTLPIERKLNELSPLNLSKTIITGILQVEGKDEFIFPPLPNLVFTRDIGITIKDHILLSKTAKVARKRESILAKYISYFELFKDNQERVIEISEDSDFFLEDLENQKNKVVTIEGGDIMMISPHHLIVGCSARTSPSAIDKIIHKVFSIKTLEIEYISVIKIKEARSQMHIDTIFTQISKENWVIDPKLSERLKLEMDKKKKNYSELLRTGKEEFKHEEVQIFQFYKQKNAVYDPRQNYIHKESSKLKGMEDFLTSISVNDFGVKESSVNIVYSGDNEFPYSEREQWTDSCNLLALKDGVVIGYDRNEKTAEAFEKKLKYTVITASELIKAFESGDKKPAEISKTLILLSSSELSRARGGSHCMSMPLLREDIVINA